MSATRVSRIGYNSQLATVVIIVGLAAVWEVVPRLLGVSELVFPPFSEVVGALLRGLGPAEDGALWGYTLATLSSLLQAYALSIAAALALAVLAVASRWAGQTLTVLTGIFQPLPSVALLPLAILWFGLNNVSIIFVVVMAMLWPLTAALSTGFATVPPILTKVGQNLELPHVGMIRHVYLPSALPSILAGMRVSWGYGWRTAIAAELVFGATGANAGLGWFINSSRTFLNTADAMAAILVVIILGLLVEGLFRLVQNRTTKKWGTER
ncbi:hypothetical protein BJF78_17530 [Pseudonocardia sp. CNS-139]|nr:hypothetical protein BJF78_17530 [Pseudonocardia sp. CNS-139]